MVPALLQPYCSTGSKTPRYLQLLVFNTQSTSKAIYQGEAHEEEEEETERFTILKKKKKKKPAYWFYYKTKRCFINTLIIN